MLVPTSARKNFWNRYAASLLTRAEAMPPIALGAAARSAIVLSPSTTRPNASSQVAGRSSPVLAHQRRAQPLGVIHVLVQEAALVADPLVVDRHVLAGDDAAQLVHALVQPQVAADRAERADAAASS